MNYCFLISESEFLLLGRALSFLTGGPVSAGRKSESYCDIMALRDLVVKSKLYPRSGSVSLRQLNPIHRKRATKFFIFYWRIGRDLTLQKKYEKTFQKNAGNILENIQTASVCWLTKINFVLPLTIADKIIA